VGVLGTANTGVEGGPGPIVVAEPEEQPLLAPVTPAMSWSNVHAMSQGRLREPRDPADVDSVTFIRRTATIRCGTRMIKILSGHQLGAYVYGRRPAGFCYREFDVAHLRERGELAMLAGDGGYRDENTIIFALRWRAVDPTDYAIPFSHAVGDVPSYQGLQAISPHDRLGPQVLGTGFAPSEHHLIPEFVTYDMADLPMPAGTSLVAFTPDGTEVSLYLYLPEQRAWTRMFGPKWRHLVASLPEIPADQEYVQFSTDSQYGSRLMGRYHDELFEALADPPNEFRVLARARAARYPVESLTRRIRYAIWRGARCTVVRAEGGWFRLRLCRPDRDSVPLLGAQCVERGLYEVWAKGTEIAELYDEDVEYEL
jgi:hypothetical protein